MDRLRALITSRRTEYFITGLIIINAITLGLETDATIATNFGDALHIFDQFILGVFVVELMLRILVHRASFFKDPWNLFDFLIVTIALLPSSGSLSVLRALRILRVLRLITFVPTLRRVVGALIGALPGMGSIILLMALVYYVFAVMATKLFGETFPQWFGTLGESAYTLFQIMTLESWSMGIVRPVMEQFPLAWLFFVPFILSTTFTVLNLFIGIIVAAMQTEHEAEAELERQALHEENVNVLEEVKALRKEISTLHDLVKTIRA
ncbi:MAG: ion transporter [Cohaesibacteraceae bacterium]|nr:ion transporter [Cohaesibacteraceae bacterium]